MVRDGHRCTLCGAPAVQVDHIVPVAEGGTHDLDNLAAICQSCHDAKTKAESARGRERASRRRQQRRTEPHPGAIA
jgi:5-methylcytosine-specific restriction protein A